MIYGHCFVVRIVGFNDEIVILFVEPYPCAEFPRRVKNTKTHARACFHYATQLDRRTLGHCRPARRRTRGQKRRICRQLCAPSDCTNQQRSYKPADKAKWARDVHEKDVELD